MRKRIAITWRKTRRSLRSLRRSFGKSSVMFVEKSIWLRIAQSFLGEAANHAEEDGGDEISL